MYRFIITLFFVVLLMFTNAADAVFAQRMPRNDIGVPGTSRPKAMKAKKSKIKYKYHEGIAYLKTGLIVEGKFKYTEPKNSVPQYIFTEKGKSKRVRKQVALSMLDSLVLVGAEKRSGIVGDSTKFIWIDNHRDLYRKVRAGTIEMFDNSRIVKEKYENLPDYVLIVGRKNYGYKVVRRLMDLEEFMTDRPYFMKSAKATGRYRTQDFRVVMYLVDMFNDATAIDKLYYWQDMTIKMRNNKTLQGKGYIQPLDMRNEFTKSGDAFLHFHDGTDFKLLSHRDIKNVTIGGTLYKRGLYTTVNKYFWGKPWRHRGSEYLVTSKVMTNNSYYFRMGQEDGTGIVLLKRAGERDSYIKPLNEIELRQTYLNELKGIKTPAMQTMPASVKFK